MFCLHLPPELLDHVVDSLRNSRDALKNCCLASKQWIPRTRKHLFANIQFRTAKDLESWKTVFPDPSTSPACYTETLFIGCPHIVADAGAGEGCWLSAFSRVAHLGMEIDGRDVEQTTVFLIPFHGFSPILKSLSMAYAGLPYSQIINLIRSFPLLEDISVDTIDCDGLDEQPTIIQPLTSPALTGSLQLCVRVRMDPVVSRLLSLPNGLHFRKIDLKWHREADTSSTTALVQGCRSTLESLKIDSGILHASSAQVNLNRATKLRDVEFTWWLDPRWILRTLQTITHDHRELKQITLMIVSLRGLNGFEDGQLEFGESIYREWLKLDRLLAQLCELHSMRLKVQHNLRIDPDGSKERSRMGILLPEVMTRGIVDLIGRRG